MSDKPCAFCTRSMIEECIIAEDDHFYLIASLGQITDGGYVLIVPKRHVACIGEMTTDEAAVMLEIAKYTGAAIKKFWGADPTIFEHGRVAQTVPHAHLHLVPVNLALNMRVRCDFPIEEIDAMISLRDLPRAYALWPEPYLFWKEPDASPMVCWNPEAPSYYFRQIVAEMLGRPERADWRAMDPELDRKLWTNTRDNLKPFFNSNLRLGKPKKKGRG